MTANLNINMNDPEILAFAEVLKGAPTGGDVVDQAFLSSANDGNFDPHSELSYSPPQPNAPAPDGPALA